MIIDKFSIGIQKGGCFFATNCHESILGYHFNVFFLGRFSSSPPPFPMTCANLGLA